MLQKHKYIINIFLDWPVKSTMLQAKHGHVDLHEVDVLF